MYPLGEGSPLGRRPPPLVGVRPRARAVRL